MVITYPEPKSMAVILSEIISRIEALEEQSSKK